MIQGAPPRAAPEHTPCCHSDARYGCFASCFRARRGLRVVISPCQGRRVSRVSDLKQLPAFSVFQTPDMCHDFRPIFCRNVPQSGFLLKFFLLTVSRLKIRGKALASETQLVETSSHKLKGFDSWLGHVPRLWVQSLAGRVWEASD